MNPEDFEKAWSSLGAPAVRGELSGVRLPEVPPEVSAWAACDDRGRRHLLIGIRSENEPLVARASRGLEISTQALRVNDSLPATYIDLICLGEAHGATFCAVACDIAASVASYPADPRAAVVRALERWRAFWAVDPSGLGREEALGLYGELWFIVRWMGTVVRAAIERWEGPAGARHDFQWSTASVEVKTAISSSRGAVHEISSLEQLDNPVTGSLYLFSLQVTEDSLSANSLPVIVDQIMDALRDDPKALELFSERLALAGYSPAHAERYRRPLRIVAEELYRVEGTFPRLMPSSFPLGLPPGVQGISYRLSMAACAPWRIASSPLDPAGAFLRAI